MRKPDQPLEPSIEEILASIRKIIADDGAQGVGGAGPIVSQTAPDLSPRGGPVDTLKTRRALFERSIVSEPEEPLEPSGDDEIMELTEDFVLDDGEAGDHDKPALADQPDEPSPSLSDKPFAPPMGEGALANVFSSVAAEVERLASGQQRRAEDKAASPSQDDWRGTDDMRHAVETYAASLSSSARHDEAPETDAESGPKPVAKPSGPAAGELANPVANPSRPSSRPVWSARHLEGDQAGARDKPRARPAARQPEPPPARPQSAARDSWAEGVQMPVPETGPAVPFGSSMEDAAPLSMTPASEAPGSEIEHEREYVSGILTRVFGRMVKKDKEEPSTAVQSISKAEQIAKEAVSDFAAITLGAPAVAEALHADKPFMETIADSLEGELAKIESRGAANPALAERPVSAAETAPAPYDELPDALLPLDSELAPLVGAPGQPYRAPAQASAAKPFFAEPSAASLADTRDLPQEAPRAPVQETPSAYRGGGTETPQSRLNAGALGAPVAAAAPSAPAQASAAMLATIPEGLENSIKELIKPLIVQWLNDNLPRIVEKAVREELAEQDSLSGFRREGSVRR